jgi:hypothetical protein
MPDSGRGRLTPSKRKFLRAAAILQFAQICDFSTCITTNMVFIPEAVTVLSQKMALHFGGSDKPAS